MYGVKKCSDLPHQGFMLKSSTGRVQKLGNKTLYTLYTTIRVVYHYTTYINNKTIKLVITRKMAILIILKWLSSSVLQSEAKLLQYKNCVLSFQTLPIGTVLEHFLAFLVDIRCIPLFAREARVRRRPYYCTYIKFTGE